MKIDLKSVTKEFSRSTKKNFAVEETNLTLEAGKLVVITGRSGSGKSTLLNMIGGLLKPTAGKIFVDDVDLYELDDENLSKFRNKNFGIIPQSHSALKNFTILENILLPANLYDAEVNENFAKKLLTDVGIENLADANPNELSGGELRRMSVARALILNPQIILADEPTGDLDDDNTEIILSILRQCSDSGKIVLLVTHENAAKKFADVVYTMTAGKLN